MNSVHNEFINSMIDKGTTVVETYSNRKGTECRPANPTSSKTLRLIYYSLMVGGAKGVASALCRCAYLFRTSSSAYAKRNSTYIYYKSIHRRVPSSLLVSSDTRSLHLLLSCMFSVTVEPHTHVALQLHMTRAMMKHVNLTI